MSIISEFKEFALKGNVVDLAVGVIIGAAFGGVTKSMVDDVLMPPIGKMLGNLDFSNMYFSLSSKVDAANAAVTQKIAATQPAVAGGVLEVFNSAARLPLSKAKELGPVIAYGNFITVLINFVIVAFVVFMLIKVMNIASRRAKVEETAAAAPVLTRDQELLIEIRDSLRRPA